MDAWVTIHVHGLSDAYWERIDAVVDAGGERELERVDAGGDPTEQSTALEKGQKPIFASISLI